MVMLKNDHLVHVHFGQKCCHRQQCTKDRTLACMRNQALHAIFRGKLDKVHVWYYVTL